jgi:hypothetical protein
VNAERDGFGALENLLLRRPREARLVLATATSAVDFLSKGDETMVTGTATSAAPRS